MFASMWLACVARCMYVRPWPCRVRGKAEDWGDEETGREEGEEREPRSQLLSSNHTVHNQFRVVQAMAWKKQPWSGTGSSWDSTLKKDEAGDGGWQKSDCAASSSAAAAKAAGPAMAARFAVHPDPSPPVFKVGHEVWHFYDGIKRVCHHWVDMSEQLGRSRGVGS